MSEPLTDRLVSPNGFDGYGTVPDKVNEAARKIARLRTTFVNQWVPGADGTLTTTEIDRLFDASAIQAEWMRELYEARDTLTTQLAEMTRERDEYRTACKYEHDYKLLVIRQRNTAQIALELVGELHKPDTVDVLPWKCVNGDCEHDDTECPEEPHQVCRECWNLWTRDGRDDECFYEDQVGWPCATAHAAALAALPTDPQDCPGCIVDAEYPVGISGTHTCRPTPTQEPTP